MRLPLLLLVLAPLAVLAQTPSVSVETLLAPGSDIDDALKIGPDGALYGSRWGPAAGFGNRTVTRLDLETSATSVYASGLVNANASDFDADGNLFVVSWGDNRVDRVTPAGVQTTYATGAGGNLSGLIIHPATGVIYVTNATTNTVSTVEPNGTLTPFLTNDGVPPELNGPVGLAIDDDGVLYVSNFSDGKILRVESNGDLTEIADLDGPPGFTTGFITYANGSLFATGIGTNIVEEVSLADGSVTTLAGTGGAGTVDGPGETAQFNGPNGIAATPSGDTLYVSEFNSQAVRRIIRTRATASEPGAEPAAVRLLVPAPNPFEEATQVRFRVDEPQHVTIAVHDALGRLVVVLTDEMWPAGDHAIPFSAGGLAAGTYTVRLHAGETVDRAALSLVR